MKSKGEKSEIMKLTFENKSFSNMTTYWKFEVQGVVSKLNSATGTPFLTSLGAKAAAG